MSVNESKSEYNSVFEPPGPRPAGGRLYWTRLYGSAKALAVSRLAERWNGLVVVIARDALHAERLEEELGFFSGGGQGTEMLSFPDWETLPYDRFSPYQDIVSRRLETLARLPQLRAGYLITSVATLMHRLAPRDYLEANTLVLKVGERLDRERFRERLSQGGYRCVSQVLEHGDFAVRGSLLDVYPMGSRFPYRIDWFDELIDTLRLFDPETQRSIESSDRIEVLPAREFPLTPKALECFRANWRERFEGAPGDCPIYREMSQGLAPGGIEYYLPLFFTGGAILFDYLPEGSVVVLDEGALEAARAFWAEIGQRYEAARHDRERPLLPPDEMFVPPEELSARLKIHPAILIEGLTAPKHAVSFSSSMPAQLPVDGRAADPLTVVKHYLQYFGGRVLFAAESKGRRETLSELLRQHQIEFQAYADWASFLKDEARIGLTIAALDQGMQLDSPRIAVVGEAQLFGERARQERRRSRAARDPESIIRDLSELHAGAPVVHEHHGVGRYLGLFPIETNGIPGEYLGIEYADADRLYVPVLSLHLITRYSGVDPGHAPLHKLGSGQWQRARAKALRRIRDVAAELLEIYARRAARKGYAFTLERDQYQAFIQEFPFEETPDQEAAIGAVVHDLQGEQPMDRLVCGDVGFGKTEVAMRAAFVAAMGGKQVAILVPTTLLAQQHYRNFKDRFAEWPLCIELLSRFRGKKDQDKVAAGLKDGAVDIVVGTHKLLQESIVFKRLGLCVIDEEHRFGVRQKERLKALRSEVDILTLTATPIPRTLNLALFGTRELSIIASPPARRIAVKTFVTEWDQRLLREAMGREISRGGQIYFLHNEVETIEGTAREVAALIPEARVRVAHGQMRERELEQVMLDFYHRRVACLVCTTIIETGIDVPNANTIIINRADKFGLAQLYQLRGRVGRSHHRAYAYLVVPSKKALKGDALRRLEAIESIEDLGIGFTLATHDLEIRGAGEILGEEQSGHIQEVGFGLFTELLERAIQALKAGRQPELDRPLDHGVEIEIHVPVLIPGDYVPDVHTRLIMYKRIANASDLEELARLEEEMIDRFGTLPQSAKDLLRITRLKQRAAPLGVRKIDLSAHGGRVLFHAQAEVDPLALVKLMQTQLHTYRFEQGDKIRITASLPDGDARIAALDRLFDQLGQRAAA